MIKRLCLPLPTSLLLLVLLLAGAWLGCARTHKTGLEIQGSPTGEVKRPRPLIVLRFDRPMVKKDQLGKQLTRLPVRLDPELPVVGQWTEARTLQLRPVNDLPPATRLTITVPDSVLALDGRGLADPYHLSFISQPLTASLRLVAPEKLGGRWAKPKPRIEVSFSQPVNTEQLLRHCAFTAKGKARVAVVPLVAAEDLAATRFTLLPERDLEADTAWRAECAAGLSGAKGPVGLQKEASVSFRTYGPLKVVKVVPGKDATVQPDGETPIEVEFTNPVSGPFALRLEPALRGFASRCYPVYRTPERLRCWAPLKPSTTYTLHVDQKQQDAFGQRLTTAFSSRFKTQSARPRLALETGHWLVEPSTPAYVAWQRNLGHVDVEAVRLSAEQIPSFLPHLNWWDSKGVNLDKLGFNKARRKLKLKGRRDKWHQLRLHPQQLVGGKLGRFYYLAVSSPQDDRNQVQEALVNFTDLAVVTKLSAAAGLIWVNSLSKGEPVAGAQVTVRDTKGRIRWHGRTGADGTAEMPGRAKLLPGSTKGDQGSGEDEEHEEWSPSWKPRLLVFVQAGDDVTFADPDRPGGLASYNFNVSADKNPHPLRLRGFMHTDRGLYRPGDTAHVRGLARVMKLGSGLRVPRGHGVEVQVQDPRGNRVLETKVRLSRFGGFSFDVPLTADARLGDYKVTAKLKSRELNLGTFTRSFSVEEYRPANFEVKAKAVKPRFVAGEKLVIGAQANYFYGAPVRGGKIVWRVHARKRSATFKGFPSHVFDDHRVWRPWYTGSTYGQDLITEQQGKLDKQGHAAMTFRIDPNTIDRDLDYLVRAEVQDESNQTISHGLAVPIHRAHTYYGVAAADGFAKAGDPMQVSIIAVNPAGKRKASKARVVVERHDWSCAWEAWGYRGSYRCKETKKRVLTRAVSIAADKPTQVSFTPRTSGDYWVIVEGRGRGKPMVAARELWVYGGGAAAWRVDDGLQFDVLADKQSYAPGDTARLLLKTTLREASGLLTIERDGVLEKQVFKLKPGQQSLEIPIRGDHAPNIYASVALFQGRRGNGKRGFPRLRMGMVNLPVKASKKRLRVKVTTDRPSYEPGQPVKATVQVTDQAGKPMAAEVALAAADEGVLSLIAFKTPDPMGVMYSPWGLGVVSATQYDRLKQLPQPNEERSTTGGDSALRLGSVRQRFMATAYWHGGLITDAKGRARVSFQAPDNLTAFRLMAVAADAGDQFGSGDQRFTVNKPLQLHRALPRFLSVTDRAQVGVVVHNETGKAGEALVTAHIEGLRIKGSTSKKVQVPAGGRVPVLFDLQAEQPGTAQLRFVAQLGQHRDAVAYSLPVTYPSAEEWRVLRKGRAKKLVNLRVKKPKGLVDRSGKVLVSLDMHGLAGIEQGLEDLIEYPYGCLEQTTSRMIPMVAVKELADELNLAKLDGPQLQKFLRIAIAKIGRHQTDSGGFSLWPGGEAYPYYTAYALYGLHLAREAGLEVNTQRIDDGIKYLKQALGKNPPESPVHNELGDGGSKAFALYVLALLGQGDAQQASRLVDRADKLPVFGRAFLARALSAAVGPKDPAVAALVSQLERAIDEKANAATIKEPNGDSLSWYMSSDTRTTAIVLETLLTLRPKHPRIRPLVRGLLAARRANGGWYTTQESVYSLMALAHYARSRGTRPTRARVIVGDELVAEAKLGRKHRVRQLSVPLDTVLSAGGKLSIEIDGAPIHYLVRSRFRRTLAHQKAFEYGMSLDQQYLDPNSGKVLKRIRLGDLVRVRWRLASSEAREHVMVAARLPAGLEPLNMRLKTSGTTPDDRKENDSWQDYWRGYRYLEIRDDRVDLAAERMSSGAETGEFLARATSKGRFIVPSATAEEMYRPENRSRTAPRRIEIVD